jgi:FKBP-type peptidyl-prolyl cis-trans isomerase FkpA
MAGRPMKHFICLALAAAAIAACGYPAPSSGSAPVAGVQATTPTPSGAANADNFNEGSQLTPVKFPDGLQFVDLKVGSGDTVQRGATVNMDYTGWLENGTKFDSSRDRGTPLCVILEANAQGTASCTSVIQGWIEGVPGMKVGGRRRLTIPPALAYGSQAQGPIPANSTLVFTVQVVSIVSNTPAPTIAPTPSPT